MNQLCLICSEPMSTISSRCSEAALHERLTERRLQKEAKS